MKFLSPEIEALYKYRFGSTNEKTLVRQSKSCGIFQDCDYSNESTLPYHQQKSK